MPKLYDLHSIPFDFEPGALTPIASGTLLAAYDDVAIPSGGAVYVDTYRDIFMKLVESPAPAAVDDLIIPTASGDGAWYRLGVASSSWTETASWTIDLAAGSNEAAGSLAAPLKTFAELVRRLPVLTQDTTVTIVGNTTEDLVGSFSASVPGLTLTILGTATEQALTAGGAVRAFVMTAPTDHPDPSTNVLGVLQAETAVGSAVLIDWDAQGLDVSRAFVETVDGSEMSTVIGGSSAPTVAETGWWDHPAGLASPLDNAEIRVVTASTAPSINIDAPTLTVVVKYLDLAIGTDYSSLNGTTFYDTDFRATRFEECVLGGPINVQGGNLEVRSCNLNRDTGSVLFSGSGTVTIRGGIIFAAGQTFEVNSNVGVNFNGAIILGGPLNVSVSSGFGNAAAPNVQLDTYGLGVFNSVGAGIQVTRGGTLYISGYCYGDGNATFGLGVSRGGAVIIASLLSLVTDLTLTGAGGDLYVSPPSGLVAPNLTPITNGVPVGAAACGTWVAWDGAPFLRSAVNLTDLSRIVGL